jgi:hypothetical protein
VTYCLNCKRDYPTDQETDERHLAPCLRCGELSGHSLCQCGNRRPHEDA